MKNTKYDKIADFHTKEPLFYMAMPVGCTCTILYDMYVMNNIEIEPKIAGLMLSAIISDTLLFKSPTCTEEDKKIAKKLADIAWKNFCESGEIGAYLFYKRISQGEEIARLHSKRRSPKGD